MKLLILFTGRTEGRDYPPLIADYVKRLGHYLPVVLEEMPNLRAAHLQPDQQKEQEADQLFARLQPADTLILLDERGEEYTSRAFSTWLARQQQTARRLVMLIGGPYGFAPRVYQRADGMVSLSRMTFPHQMVRLFLVEQLYRAATILKGESYHHD